MISQARNVIRTLVAFSPALRLVWESGPNLAIARGILEVLLGILPLGLFYISKLLIDALSTGLIANGSDIHQPITKLLIAAIAISFTLILCNALSELVSTAQSRRIIDYTQDILHGKSIAVDLEFYENPAYHDTLQRAQQEASYRPLEILKRVVGLTYNGVSALAVIGVLLKLHWSIPLILLVAALPVALARVDYSRAFHRWFLQQTPRNRLSWYISQLMVEDTFAKEVRLFDIGSFFRGRFRNIRENLYNEHMKLARRRFILILIAQLIAGSFALGIVAFIVFQTFQGSMTVGSLVFYYQTFNRGNNSIRGVFSGTAGLYEDGLFLSNLYDFLKLEPSMAEPENPKPFITPIRDEIRFNHVSFGYEGTTRQAISDVNLTLKPGEVVALVGENGSGKTTLVKLLCRLYDPTGGNITIDGIDIRDYKMTDLRQHITVLFQDYAKYHLTAQENIWLGNVKQPANYDLISKAALRSGADSVIETLPHGYNTVLGKRFQEGEELSIGQWQKVALARAFFRDSQIIILDEPTSALDPKAEYEVFQRFRELMHGQTAILITHRLASARMADRIYVMDKGKVVEAGTHEELMEARGVYSELFNIQATYYL